MTSSRLRLDDGIRLQGVRVLVVDAHYVREAVAEILTRDGAKVTAVGSADEALAALQWELCRIVKDSEHGCPGVAQAPAA